MVGPKGVRGRRRAPALILNRRIPEAQDVGGQSEWGTFGFLFDTILTRDPFMHRLDISQVTGVPVPATAEHEGVLVDDIVREWAARHGREFKLELSGLAGGTWGSGDAELITMDAFDFCRILAGRKPVTGLLEEQVPFDRGLDWPVRNLLRPVRERNDDRKHLSRSPLSGEGSVNGYGSA